MRVRVEESEHDISTVVYEALSKTMKKTECPAIRDIIHSAAVELRSEIERVQDDDQWSEFLSV